MELFNYTQLDLIVPATGGTLVLLTMLLAGILAYMHLSYFMAPQAQTYIIRIIMMAPIYGINSMLSLIFHKYSLYFDIPRDCYEAFVLYQFFALLLYYFNSDAINHFPSEGDDKRLRELSNLSDYEAFATDTIQEVFIIEEPIVIDTTSHYLSKIGLASYPFPCCCCPSVVPGNVLLTRIRLCVYQYMIIKPVVSIVAVILHTLDLYHHGSFDWRYGYLWITIIVNISIFVALYYLAIFYQLVHHVIKNHRPLSKLVSIKVVLFFLFWQTVGLEFAVYMKWIPLHFFEILGGHTASSINNLLIVVEMFLLAIANFLVFSHNEYKLKFLYHTILDPNVDEKDIEMSSKDYTSKRVKKVFSDVLNPMDLINDGKNIMKGKDTKVL